MAYIDVRVEPVNWEPVLKDGSKQQRHAQIAESAYRVLAEKGYAGSSLLTIAKVAKASNETLYRWYGSKVGLFEAMVRDNAAETRLQLEAAVIDDADPVEVLRRVAPVLLAMLVGERAVLLNRAAAADASDELGQAIAHNGRDAVAPLIARVMARLATRRSHEAGEMAESFLTLLIGDLQIRRVIGALPEPSAEDVARRAEVAVARFLVLYP